MFEISYEDNSGSHRNSVCGNLLGHVLRSLAEQWAQGDIGNLQVFKGETLVNAEYDLPDYQHATTRDTLDSREDPYGLRECLESDAA